ncbi:MAG: hypothetical protein AB1679_26615 [Actinomycetota bacterium]
MKRTLTAAIFGGLIAVFVPQAVMADHNAGQNAGDCAGRPQGAHDPEQSAPGGGSQYDHEQRESDGGEVLF